MPNTTKGSFSNFRDKFASSSISVSYSLMLEQLDRKKYPELDAWIRSENQRTESTLKSSPMFDQLQRDLKKEAQLSLSTSEFFLREKSYLRLDRSEEFPDGIFYLGPSDFSSEAEPCFVIADMKSFFGVSVQFSSVEFFESSLALFHFSIEGKDVTKTREYDLVKKCWLEQNPFLLSESRGEAKYFSKDIILFTQSLPMDELSDAKSSRRIRQWQRGQKIEDAKIIFEGPKNILMVWFSLDKKSTKIVAGISRSWNQTEYFILNGDHPPISLNIPVLWNYLGVFKNHLVLQVTENNDDFIKGDVVLYHLNHHKYSLAFRSANKCYLNHLEMTDDYLILQVLADLKSELWIYEVSESNCRLIQKIYKADCTLSSSSAFKNHVVIQKVGYLTPPHSELWDLDQIKNLTTGQIALDLHDSIDCKIRDLFAAETNFPYLDYQISRHSAVSVDGVQIPYFVISKKGSGTQPVPCLMYAYGGFARIPAVQFLGLIGTAWLQNGGCYVVAHIRGGNEYGPDWHQAAVQENRWKCFEDFANVGKDLIHKGLTTSKQLAIRGGSNGGLLVAETARRYPELIAAVICLKPVLDMRMYSHWLVGKYWMDEYGNPDLPEHWDFMKKYCPYYQLDLSQKYPPIYIETLSTDDRVHPAHARNLAQKLKDLGMQYLFFESNEGGHMYRVAPSQIAELEAMRFSFLFREIQGETART